MESKKYISQAKGFGFSKDGVRWIGNTPYQTVFYTTMDGTVWVLIVKSRSGAEIRIELPEFIEKFYLTK